MIYLVKEYENQFIDKGIKLYPGDILFSASKAINFIYELSGHILNEDEKSVFHGYKYFKDKFDYLDSLNVKVTFAGVDNEIFNLNLMLVDTQMPVIIGDMLENFYRGKANRVTELTDLCAAKNICNISNDNKEVFYSYKIKELMESIIPYHKKRTKIPLTPSDEWTYDIYRALDDENIITVSPRVCYRGF